MVFGVCVEVVRPSDVLVEDPQDESPTAAQRMAKPGFLSFRTNRIEDQQPLTSTYMDTVASPSAVSPSAVALQG